ncbi:MAG: uncharacterized protein JWN48_664 [Myxococcaceae bacterium]|nr:uncharacterized protein [Myxococcaceae bacterium]
MRLLLGLMAASSIVLGAGCAQATQTYALILHPLGEPSAAVSGTDKHAQASDMAQARPSRGDESPKPVGSLSVERIEGGQRLVVLQLDQLPPPERIAPGLHAFVVWLEDPRGGEVKVGTLHYDRAHRSGNLLATTELSAFTVRVTGERDDRASEPSGVLLAERRVVPN